MESTDVRAPFLIMAHHRSGSNFLHDLLQAHPAIECINEPLSMHTRFFRHCDLVQWSDAEFDPHVLHVALAKHPGLRAYLDEFKAYLLESNRTHVVGFKETALFGKLAWLKEFMPSLKVIFLTREPHAIVSSVLRCELADFWRYRDLVPRLFQEMWPDYRGRRADADPQVRAAEIAAMSVVTRYELARRSLHLFDHRIVSLDALMQTPQAPLRSITDLLEIDPHADQFSFLAQRQITSRGGAFSSFRSPDEVRGNWRRHLSDRQVEAIDGVLLAVQGPRVDAGLATEPGIA